MLDGMRRRKQKRPQHLTKFSTAAAASAEAMMAEATLVQMRSSKTGLIISTPSMLDEEDSTGELRINEEFSSSDNEHHHFKCRTSESDDVSSAPKTEEHLTNSSDQTNLLVRSSGSFSLTRNVNGLTDNLFKPNPDFRPPTTCPPQQNSATGSTSEGANEVIGRESHVTKLQSFVDSLTNLSNPPNRFCDFTMSSVYLPFFQRLENVSANSLDLPYSTVQENPVFRSSSSSSTHRLTNSYDLNLPSSEEPLDLSTKRSLSRSNFKGQDSVDTNLLEIHRQKLSMKQDVFEKFMQLRPENVGFLPFVMPPVRFGSTEQNFSTRSKNSNKRLDSLSTDRQKYHGFQELRVDVSSQSIKSRSPKSSEIDGNRRKKRAFPDQLVQHQSEENMLSKRKLAHHTEGILKVEKRNFDHARSHQSSKCSGQSGKRLKGSGEGQAMDHPTSGRVKRVGTDWLRTKCNCGVVFESLYQLAVHIQKSGHLPENQRTDSMNEDLKSIHSSRGHLTGTEIEQMDDFDNSLDRDENQNGQCDRKSMTCDQDVLPSMTDLYRRLAAENGLRELGKNSSGGNGICLNSSSNAVDLFKFDNSTRTGEISRKEALKRSESEENKFSSVEDRSPRDGEEPINRREEKPVSPVSNTDMIISRTEKEMPQPCSQILSTVDHADAGREIGVSTPLESITPRSTAISLPKSTDELRHRGGFSSRPTICVDANSNGQSALANVDYTTRVSFNKRCAMKANERRKTRSRDQPSGDERKNCTEKTTKLPSRRSKSERMRTNGTSLETAGNHARTTKEVSSPTTLTVSQSVSDVQQSKRRIERNDLDPERQEKETFSSDARRLSTVPGTSPAHDASDYADIGGKYLCHGTKEEIPRNSDSNMFFVSPSLEAVDSSFSILAMKNFVDNHFASHDNGLSTKGNTSSPRNNRITNDLRTSHTIESDARYSSLSPTPTRSKEAAGMKRSADYLCGHGKQVRPKDKIGDLLDFSDDAVSSPKERKGVVRSQASHSDPASSGCSSFPLHGQLSRERSPKNSPKNGVTAVQSESLNGIANAGLLSEPEAEKCADVADTIPIHIEKSHSHDFTRDKSKFSPPSETNLTLSEVDDDDAEQETNRVSTPGPINRFCCNESLEQVC